MGLNKCDKISIYHKRMIKDKINENDIDYVSVTYGGNHLEYLKEINLMDRGYKRLLYSLNLKNIISPLKLYL